jgi:hypothetical protein
MEEGKRKVFFSKRLYTKTDKQLCEPLQNEKMCKCLQNSQYHC